MLGEQRRKVRQTRIMSSTKSFEFKQTTMDPCFCFEKSSLGHYTVEREGANLCLSSPKSDRHPTVNGRGRRELGHPAPTFCAARNLPTPSQTRPLFCMPAHRLLLLPLSHHSSEGSHTGWFDLGGFSFAVYTGWIFVAACHIVQ
ncbi:hypothetical protein F0562_016660 [Nyssa sinensis]|uniref:Uncharacterized protein n=1 Tax=Nyssa sinensis TaxID=561372 RepID=A0A5J4ZGJ5_9ASTE|nr:hypothetical protein F0562_016660 [Nyssa sinensis]